MNVFNEIVYIRRQMRSRESTLMLVKYDLIRITFIPDTDIPYLILEFELSVDMATVIFKTLKLHGFMGNTSNLILMNS